MSLVALHDNYRCNRWRKFRQIGIFVYVPQDLGRCFIIFYLLCSVCLPYTLDSRFSAVQYNTILHTAQQLDKTLTGELWVSFLSYFEKRDREILGARGAMVHYLSKPNRMNIALHFHDYPLIDCAIDFFWYRDKIGFWPHGFGWWHWR